MRPCRFVGNPPSNLPACPCTKLASSCWPAASSACCSALSSRDTEGRRRLPRRPTGNSSCSTFVSLVPGNANVAPCSATCSGRSMVIACAPSFVNMPFELRLIVPPRTGEAPLSLSLPKMLSVASCLSANSNPIAGEPLLRPSSWNAIESDCDVRPSCGTAASSEGSLDRLLPRRSSTSFWPLYE